MLRLIYSINLTNNDMCCFPYYPFLLYNVLEYYNSTHFESFKYHGQYMTIYFRLVKSIR